MALFDFPAVTTFNSSILGVWKFDQTAEDDVAQNDFIPTTGSASYKSIQRFNLLQNKNVTRSALLFEAGKGFTVTDNSVYSDDFTLSFFWFSPAHIGFTRHVTTRELQTKIAPIIAKSNFITVQQNVTLQNASFVVTEVSFSSTKNAIRVYLSQDEETISHIITSEGYDPVKEIHVLMTYIRAEGRFRIDINGKKGVLHTAPIFDISTSGTFRINQVVPGSTAHQTEQVGGAISDVVFSSDSATNNEATKVMRYGYEFISFAELADTKFDYLGISYPQPNTISTTKIIADGSNIFATRSNGEILKGDRPIWDKEFAYPTPQSVSLLTTSQTDSSSDSTRKIAWTPEGVNIQGVTVRI